MSSNYEKAEEALSSFNETPIFEEIEPEDSYTRRLRVLHVLEDFAWEEVERGKIAADVAELAVWACVDWLEGTNEQKGCY